MSIVKQVPINADGGYWSVVRPIETGEDGRTVPVTPPWCAWYRQIGGEEYAVVRTPTARPEAPDVESVAVTAVLAAVGLGIPKGRNEGK